MTSSKASPTTASAVVSRSDLAIAMLAIAAIAVHLAMRVADAPYAHVPLWVALVLGGVPLVWELLVQLVRREFGSDLLAGISIVTAVILGEYLAGTLVVLMLSGGQALEAYAARSASSALEALARRMPSVAHRRIDGTTEEVPIDRIDVGDVVVVLPHEICPIDGTVVEGHGVMDESFLTGEPYMMSKTPGAAVLSGAVNGEEALTVRADRRAVDSRYARIMAVMQATQQRRPRLRRLGDQLGAWYTPLAVAMAVGAWLISGEATRFLAVLVVATPCPLLIAIPVAIIGAISLAAKRAIIIRDPVVLERVDRCRTMIFDKTGTLTYGRPRLVEQVVSESFDAGEVLSLAASLERYSKHPLAEAVTRAAREASVAPRQAGRVSEPPGRGLRGEVGGRSVQITSRAHVKREFPQLTGELPPQAGGLECVVLIDERFAALYRFRDAPRREGAQFVGHLKPRHRIDRVMLVSGDRESEVRYLAEEVGITEVRAGQSPEQKVEIVREETARAGTVFVGDGINDAPALAAATVGVALGTNSDITTEAAGAVVLDSSLEKVDELLHIGGRMRRIALQSVLGGMTLSLVGMVLAAAGYLPPVAGAIAQEVIDVFAVLNALRTAFPPRTLVDYDRPLDAREARQAAA